MESTTKFEPSHFNIFQSNCSTESDSARQRIWFGGTRTQGSRSADNLDINSHGDLQVTCHVDMTQDIVRQSTPMNLDFGNMTEVSGTN